MEEPIKITKYHLDTSQLSNRLLEKAVFTGFIVYMGLAFWFAHQVSQELLLSDNMIIFMLS